MVLLASSALSATRKRSLNVFGGLRMGGGKALRVSGVVRSLVLGAAFTSAVFVSPAYAWDPPSGPVSAEEVPQELDGIEIVEHLGDSVPTDISLRNSEGKSVLLKDMIKGDRPVVVNFVYHTCPTLCSMVMAGFTASVRDPELPWLIGEKFDVITVSIDLRDTPDVLMAKKAQYVQKYGRSESSAAGWHFVSGVPSEVKRLADAIGFKYKWDAKAQQYSHAAAIFVLTPGGKISRYLYGIDYPAQDMRLALAEAAEGKSVSTYEKLLLYCYHYDPASRGYVLVAMNVMRLCGALTVLLLGAFLSVFWLREARLRKTNPVVPGSDTPRTSIDVSNPSPANRGGSL